MTEDTRHSDPADGSGSTAPDPTGSQASVERTDRRLSPPLIAALALGVALVVGVAIAGAVLGRAPTASAAAPAARPPVAAQGPVLLVPVAAPQSGSTQCTALLGTLPANLSNGRTPLRRRQLAAPAPRAAAAWGGTSASDPVVLRCGIERPPPPELTLTTELQVVDGVQWLPLSADGDTTFYAVDRAVTVALTLPGNVTSGGPLQDLSEAITATMPAKSVF